MNLILKVPILTIQLIKVSRKVILFHASVTTNSNYLEKKKNHVYSEFAILIVKLLLYELGYS